MVALIKSEMFSPHHVSFSRLFFHYYELGQQRQRSFGASRVREIHGQEGAVGCESGEETADAPVSNCIAPKTQLLQAVVELQSSTQRLHARVCDAVVRLQEQA